MLLGWRATQSRNSPGVQKGGLSAWRGQAKALRRPASAGCRSDVEAEAPPRSMHVVALKTLKSESEAWFGMDIYDVFGPNTPPACFTDGSLMPVAECSCLPWCKSGCSFAVPPCVSCDPHGVGLGSGSSLELSVLSAQFIVLVIAGIEGPQVAVSSQPLGFNFGDPESLPGSSFLKPIAFEPWVRMQRAKRGLAKPGGVTADTRPPTTPPRPCRVLSTAALRHFSILERCSSAAFQGAMASPAWAARAEARVICANLVAAALVIVGGFGRFSKLGVSAWLYGHLKPP